MSSAGTRHRTRTEFGIFKSITITITKCAFFLLFYLPLPLSSKQLIHLVTMSTHHWRGHFDRVLRSHGVAAVRSGRVGSERRTAQ